jgi:hypothetical protein
MHEHPVHRYESRILLALPVALYLFLCVLYLFAIPPGESPDEPSHLQCIEQVSILNRIPIVDPLPSGLWWTRERVISGLTCYHLPLYYLTAGYTQKTLAQITGEPLHYELPPTAPNFATGASVAMFRHESKAHFLTLTEPKTLTALRVLSILLGLLVFWATYRLARRLAPALPYAPILAMTLVAGWPQFVFMSRAISNDILAAALSSATLAVLVGSDHPRRYIAASALAVAAFLSKTTTSFVVGVAMFSWATEWRSVPVGIHRGQLIRSGLVSLVILSALVALLALQPALREKIQTTTQTVTSINPAAQTVAYWGNVFRTTLQSGWGRFGWMNLATPDSQVYAWWGFLAISGAIGFISATRQSHDSTARRVILISILWAMCALALYSRFQFNRFQPQFRLVLSVVPVLTAFSGIGISAFLGASGRLQRLAILVLLALLLVANLWIVFAVLVPAYAR